MGEASSIVVGIICPNPFGIGLTKPPKSGGLPPFSTAVRYVRAAMIGKPPKGLGLALPGLCRIESGGSSGGTPLMWQPCLLKIGRGGPVCNKEGPDIP